MNDLVVLIMAVAIVLLLILVGTAYAAVGRANRNRDEISKDLATFKDSVHAQMEKARADAEAELKRRQFEFEALRKNEITEHAKASALLELEQWKEQEEQGIRANANRHQRATITGQIAEQFVPFSQKFKYDAKDARFLGNPIDFIVFDAPNSPELIERIVFLEIKTAGARLSPKQRSLEEAVRLHKVEFESITVDPLKVDQATLDVGNESVKLADVPKDGHLSLEQYRALYDLTTTEGRTEAREEAYRRNQDPEVWADMTPLLEPWEYEE